MSLLQVTSVKAWWGAGKCMFKYVTGYYNAYSKSYLDTNELQFCNEFCFAFRNWELPLNQSTGIVKEL